MRNGCLLSMAVPIQAWYAPEVSAMPATQLFCICQPGDSRYCRASSQNLPRLQSDTLFQSAVTPALASARIAFQSKASRSAGVRATAARNLAASEWASRTRVAADTVWLIQVAGIVNVSLAASVAA